MPTHQFDILLSRIESLELCVATLSLEQRGRSTWDHDRWFKDPNATNWTNGEIMTPQEIVNKKALFFGDSYQRMVAGLEQLRAKRIENIKREEVRARLGTCGVIC